jgi:hypothetical protein
LFEEEFPSFVGELYGSTGQGLGMPRGQLLAIDDREYEPVDQQWTKFLHQIQREGRLGGPNAVEITEVWIESDLFQSPVYGYTKHAVTE